MQAGKATLLILMWTVRIPRWGITGAAAGLLVSEWAGTPIFTWWVHRRLLNLGIWGYRSGSCWRPCATGLLLAVASLAIHGFVGSWLSLTAFGAGIATAYLAAGFALLDPDTKNLLYDWLRRRTVRPETRSREAT